MYKKLYMPEYRIIPLNDLVLDANNPRLPASKHGSSETEILKYMLLDSSLIELMLAIGENDFFPGEQLLVVPQGDEHYKVVEGNRRLSALKILDNPNLVDVQRTKVEKVLEETHFRPTQIPCLVFNSESEIHNYLGYRHITGIKEWRLLEKARYLFGLKNNRFTHLAIDPAAREIAKIIGSKKDYVKRILIGFQIYKVIEDEAFFRVQGLDDTTFYFNYIADSLLGSRHNISDFLGVNLTSENPLQSLNIQNLKIWTEWFFQRNEQGKTRLIGDSYDLTALNAILGKEDARVAFIESGYSLERARELTDELDEQFKIFIQKATEFLEQADRLVSKTRNFYETTKDELRNIRVLTSKISRTIQEREDEEIDQ